VRTTWGVAFALSIAVAVLIFQGSGWIAVVGGDDPTQGLGPMGEDVEQKGNSSAIEQESGGISGAATGGDQPLIAFIFQGLSAVFTTAKIIVGLPGALVSLGMPGWLVYPLGSLLSLLTSIGVFQFVSGRVWK